MPADDSARSDAAHSDTPDEHIPLQGTHQGETEDPLTSSVRGQDPPDPTPRAERVEEDDQAADRSEEAAGDAATEEEKGEADGEEASAEEERPDELGAYQISRDPASGRHRVRLRPPEEEGESPGGGFEEVSRHSSPEDMSEALDGQRPDGPGFVVLENTDTGDTYLAREGATGNTWFADGRFDQATVFDSEEEAEAYADERGN